MSRKRKPTQSSAWRRTLMVFVPLLIVGTLTAVIVPALAQGTTPPQPIPPTVSPPDIVDPIIPEPPPCCGVATDPEWLSIDYQRVNVVIEEQIANTHVAMQFTNNGEMLAEGTFIFPLPRGAAVDQLTMTIDGLEIESKILRAEEARAIYDAIVRQYRDPALLEYIGQDLIQANVFPIPPGESRQIDIRYGQLLTFDNGLAQFIYPIHTAGTRARTIQQMSVRVEIRDDDPIGAVYSPSHRVALNRMDDNSAVVGFEEVNYQPGEDFSLYYGLRQETVDLSLLTYRESASEDGFFLLMVQPPAVVDDAAIVPKDVVLVVDQSGSMGEAGKWEQARQAAQYVLRNLQPQDRFNLVVFSTGWRVYANELLPASESEAAAQWLNGLWAEGGTDINGALETAFGYVQERPMTVLFLTDGLATEGITATDAILANLNERATPNLRVFTFGVGNDVDTQLLDALVRDFRGSSSYVRPTERIDEEVASLYNKISAPVMTDIALNIDGVLTELAYPDELPDLFAGEQLTIVGRYRSGSAGDIILSGQVNGVQQEIRFDGAAFTDRAGGEPFIARLWATRRIGELLNAIRLNGESAELVNSVVNLSIRYGIITPYTSFLIEEDDILSQQGRARAMDDFAAEAEELATVNTGASAVDAADMSQQMRSASAPAALPQAIPGTPTLASTAAPSSATGGAGMPAMEPEQPAPVTNPLQQIAGKTFILQDGIWTDTVYEPDSMTPTEVVFLSDDYFALLDEFPEAGEYLVLGDQIILVLDGSAYQIIPE